MSPANSAQDRDIRQHLVGALRVVRCVQRCGGRRNGKWPAAHQAGCAVRLPGAEHGLQNSGLAQKTFPFAERQSQDVGHLQVVMPVEPALRLVDVVVFRYRDLQGAVAAVETRGADRFPESVRGRERVAVGEAALQTGLQRIVMAPSDRIHFAGGGAASELLEQDLSGSPSADGTPVQRPVSELANLSGGHVACFGDEAALQPLLHRQVPGLDVASIQVGRDGLSGDVGRHIDDPVPQAGDGNRRNAIRKPAGGREGVQGWNHQLNENRMVRSQCPGERIRVIADTISAANHHAVAGPVGEPKPWRKQLLGRFDAQIPGNRAHTSDVHLVVLGIVALKTAVGAARHRKIFPAHAVRDGELGADLPAVPEIEALPPGAGAIGKYRQQVFAGLVREAEEKRRKRIRL